MSASDVEALLNVLSKIASPSFHELVFELHSHSPSFSSLPLEGEDQWGGVDKFLEERFSGRKDFRVVIRSSESRDSLTLESYARENFPLMTIRGCIHSETWKIDERWR
jgi:hypothetical protein